MLQAEYDKALARSADGSDSAGFAKEVKKSKVRPIIISSSVSALSLSLFSLSLSLCPTFFFFETSMSFLCNKCVKCKKVS